MWRTHKSYLVFSDGEGEVRKRRVGSGDWKLPSSALFTDNSLNATIRLPENILVTTSALVSSENTHWSRQDCCIAGVGNNVLLLYCAEPKLRFPSTQLPSTYHAALVTFSTSLLTRNTVNAVDIPYFSERVVQCT